MPLCALCYPVGSMWVCTHLDISRRLEGLRTCHSYIGILYHNSLYNSRYITLLFIYLKIKKKIYRNAKNKKKSTEKIRDGVNSSAKWRVVALFYPEKHNFFFVFIFTRTKREQNNSLNLWYNIHLSRQSTRSSPQPQSYPQSYPQAYLCYPPISPISLIKYMKKYCIIKTGVLLLEHSKSKGYQDNSTDTVNNRAYTPTLTTELNTYP